MAYAGGSFIRIQGRPFFPIGRYLLKGALSLPDRGLSLRSGGLGELGKEREEFMKYDPVIHGTTQSPEQHAGLLEYEAKWRAYARIQANMDPRNPGVVPEEIKVGMPGAPLAITPQQGKDFSYKLNIRPSWGGVYATSSDPHYEDIVGVVENMLVGWGGAEDYQQILRTMPLYALDNWEHVQKPDGIYYRRMVGTSWQTTPLGAFAIIITVVGTAAIGGALLAPAAAPAAAGAAILPAVPTITTPLVTTAPLVTGAAPLVTGAGGFLGTGISLSTVSQVVGIASTGYKMLATPSSSIGPSSSPPVIVGYNPQGAPIYSNVGTGVGANSFVPSGDSAVPWLGTGELPPEGLFGVPWLYVILGGGGLVLLYMMSTQRRASYTPVQQTVGLSANLRRRRRR